MLRNKARENLDWQADFRVAEDLRRRLAVVAAASGASVNAWITALLDHETQRVLQEHEVVG
jgi:predicted HicB family RNase H-like nuclease